MADIRPIAIDDADSIIHAFHRHIKLGKDAKAIELPNMTAEEKKKLAEKEREDAQAPEKRQLEQEVADEVATEQTIKKARTNGVTA